jgi:hypothetical protein
MVRIVHKIIILKLGVCFKGDVHYVEHDYRDHKQHAIVNNILSHKIIGHLKGLNDL